MRYRPDPAAERRLRRHPGLEKHLRRTTGELRIAAYRAAPNESGYYRRHLRAIGTRLVALDPFSHLVEWGSVHNPPYAPLRRAVRAVGLRFREHSK